MILLLDTVVETLNHKLDLNLVREMNRNYGNQAEHVRVLEQLKKIEQDQSQEAE